MFRNARINSSPKRRDRSTNPSSPKTPHTPKTLLTSASQKYFRRHQAGSRDDAKEQKPRSTHREILKAYEKQAANGNKLNSPRKKAPVDSAEYKKLHEKLDVIETKITDMKRNLQKKKEEKQKQQEQKHKIEKENNKKNGLK